MVRKWIYAILNTQITKDESLRKFDTVYPAAGNGHTAVKLTLQELEAAAGAEGWVEWMSARSRKANKKGPSRSIAVGWTLLCYILQ